MYIFYVIIKSPFVFGCPHHMCTLFLLFFLVEITLLEKPFHSSGLPELCAVADL